MRRQDSGTLFCNCRERSVEKESYILYDSYSKTSGNSATMGTVKKKKRSVVAEIEERDE